MSQAASILEAATLRIRVLHDRYETHVPLILGCVVGLGAGLGAAAFRELIAFFHGLFFEDFAGQLDALGDARVILIPAAGALFVGPLVYFFAREAKGHGVPEVMLAVQTQGGIIRPRVAAVKAFASSICIGSGGSVGREGPIVQIGSALGSTLAQILRMPPETTKLLVACGAAGGISGTFNAPIAGVFFALEVILRSFNMRSFSVVVLASVIAAAIAQALVGNDPAFAIPPYALENTLVEIPLYALLGILAAPVGLAFMFVLHSAEDAFDRIPMPEWGKPVIGGLAVGTIGIWYSDVFGVGYGGVTEALLEDKAVEVMVILVVMKILATSLTLGSGGSGGVFAPSLFIGAMFGGAFGVAVHSLFPGATATSGAYATVGMGAVFAGTARAPITAIIILFEMTRDYEIILPLMIAVVLSAATSQFLYRESIYTAKLKRRGIDLLEAEERPILRNLAVALAMNTDFSAVNQDASLGELAELLTQTGRNGVPVVDAAGELSGMVSQSDLDRIAGRDPQSLTVLDIATTAVTRIFPDQTLDETMQHMSAQGLRQVPVVSRSNPRRILGMLSRSDIFAAYSSVRGEQQGEPTRQTGAASPAIVGRARFVEMEVGVDAPAVGAEIRTLSLPIGSSLVRIIRGDDVIIPHGVDVILVGDRITSIAVPDAIPELQAILGARTPDVRRSVSGAASNLRRLTRTLTRRNGNPDPEEGPQED